MITLELAKSEVLDHLPPSMPYADLSPLEKKVLAASILTHRGDHNSQVFAGQLLIGQIYDYRIVDDLAGVNIAQSETDYRLF